MPPKNLQETLAEMSTKVVTGPEAAQTALEKLLTFNWSSFKAEVNAYAQGAPKTWKDEIWTMEDGQLVNQSPITVEKMLKRMGSGEVFIIPDGEGGDIRCLSAARIGDDWYFQSMNAPEAMAMQEKRRQKVAAGEWTQPREPDLLDKIGDFFCRLFGSRKEVCAQWDLYHKDSVVAQRAQAADLGGAKKWFEEQEKEIDKNFTKLLAGLETPVTPADVADRRRIGQTNAYWGCPKDPLSDVAVVSVQEDFTSRLAFSDGEGCRDLTSDERLALRIITGFAVVLTNPCTNNPKEELDIALSIARNEASPERMEEAAQFQQQLIAGNVKPEVLDYITVTLERAFLNVDPLSREGRYVGMGLRMINNGLSGSLRSENCYQIAENTDFLLGLQEKAFGATENIRELCKSENFDSYEEYTSRLTSEVASGITAREFLKQVNGMTMAAKHTALEKYGKAFSSLEGKIKTYAAKNVTNTEEALQAFGGGHNSNLLAKFERENQQKQLNEEVERRQRERDWVNSRNWTTAAEVEARQNAKQSGGMQKK